MEGFGCVREQEVEFRDLDGLGHVNNAVYLSYFARREPVPVPASWREKIEAYEARSPAAA